MDVLTASRIDTAAGADNFRLLMRNYAMLLGVRETEANALAAAIASGANGPKTEPEALSCVERAVLDPADPEGSDRMLLATWLAAKDSDRDPGRLPKAGPSASGLAMPAQNLSSVSFLDVAAGLGLVGRPNVGVPSQSLAARSKI